MTTRFKPIDGKYERLIVRNVYCHLRCRNGKTVDISVSCYDGFKAWLMDVPFEDFCTGIRNLKANTEGSINTVRSQFVAEWSLTDCGLVLAYKGGQIDVSAGHYGAMVLVEYAEDFISEVKEQIDAQAA